MRIRILALASFLLFLPVCSAAGQELQKDSFRGRDVVAQEVIVRFRAANTSQRRVAAELVSSQDLDIESAEPLGGNGAVRLRSRGRNVAALIQAYSARPDVEYVEPNYIVHESDFPNDLSLGQQWALINTGQSIGGQFGIVAADIKARQAWSITPGSRSIVVGVIDSGIDKNHLDLKDNLWSSPTAFTFSSGGVTFNCPAGTRGYSATADGCLPSSTDEHGTHVAGIIGATGNNGFGVTGVSPMVQLMDLQFLDQSGSGTTAGAIKLIDFAIGAKAFFGAAADVRVLNASWGGLSFSQALQDEINLAGSNNMLFVASAGNASQNVDLSPHYPSSYDAANIIAVAATDNRDNLASFSNFGLSGVDIAAPGVNVYSTLPSQSFGLLTGTSMAAPMVSGAAALVLSACPSLSVAQLKAALISPASVDALPSLTGKVGSGGRLNVFKALQSCGATTPVSDFRITASPGFPVTMPGTTIYASVALSSIGSFSNDVNLTLNVPAGFTASLSSSVLSNGAPAATLIITPGAGVTSGNYLIGVTGVANGVSRTTGVETVVTAVQTVGFQSALSTDNYRHPITPDTYLAFSAFVVGARTVTIDVKSTAFETIAYILDANGSLVAFDHGGGGGFNSRIVTFLPAGNYFLQVSNAVPGQVGTFNVSSDVAYISSITPTALSRNATGTIFFTGAAFGSGMSVHAIDGVTISNFSSSGPTSVRANFSVSPVASIGPRSVYLVDSRGDTNSVTFNVLPLAPAITSIGPTSGLSGTVVDVTITGTNFYDPLSVVATRGAAGQIPVNSVTINSTTSATVRFTVPTLTYASNKPFQSTVDIRVSTASGNSNSLPFSVIPPPPEITNVFPSDVHQGKSFFVQLLGSNLIPPIVFNAGPDITTGVVEHTDDIHYGVVITVSPVAGLGPRNISITSAGGASNSISMTVRSPLPPPQLTSITPNVGHPGEVVEATFSGDNFGGYPITINVPSDLSHPSAVLIDSKTVSAKIFISSIAAYGPRTLSVTTLWGTTTPVTFSVTPPPPTLTNIVGSTVTRGTFQNVTFSGANFVAPASIAISGGGVTVSNVRINSSISMTATLSVASTADIGVRTATITTPGGTSAGASLYVAPIPILTGITPPGGKLGKSVEVTISGTNFVPEASVYPGPGITVSNLAVSDSSITATLAISSSTTLGNHTVTVSNLGVVSNAMSFNVVTAVPSLASLLPSSAVRGSIVPIALTGSNFDSSLTMNAGPDIGFSAIDVTSATTATALMSIGPAALIGNRSFLVTTQDGTSAAMTFNVVPQPPVVSVISPSRGGQGSTVAVTVTGLNLFSPISMDLGTGVTVANITLANSQSATATLSIALNAVLGPRTLTLTAAGGTGNAVSFTVDPPQLSISKSGSGSGNVMSTPAGIDCGLTCSMPVASGQSFTLMPLPAAGSVFAGWSGDADCLDGSVSITASRTCVARFDLPQANSTLLRGDYDGDGKTDIAVYRPITGEWFLRLSTQDYVIGAGNWYFQWGVPGDVPLSGDYDGDGKSDVSVYRPSTGEWFHRLSTQAYAIAAGNWTTQWGVPGDIPITGDFDGDGKTDPAVYRPSTGEWFLRLSSQNYVVALGSWYFQWGVTDDQPQAGDFDGDGKTDIAVYRPSSGEWFIRLSTLNYAVAAGNWYFHWGVPGDQPIAGDYDGDRKTDIAVYRPSTGEWFMCLSTQNYAVTGPNTYFVWGVPGDLSLRGDFDGDAKADLAVYRPSTGEWYFRLTTYNYAIAQGFWYFQWGVPGDLPFRR